MKRAELEALGLTKEQVDEVIKINGADIENAKAVAKAEAESIQTENEALKGQVKDRDKQIDDLKKFGMLPELLGRLPVLCTLRALSEESLVRILTEPKNALVKQYQTLFAEYGTKLDFTTEALAAIAKKANERGTGARALRGIMENVLGDVMYDAPGEENLCEVLVDIVDGEIAVSKDYEELEGVC